MIRLQKITLVFAFALCTIALQAQTDPYQNVIASNDFVSTTTKVTDAKISSSSTKYIQETYIAESFLNANNGFIGIVFSEAVSQPNIYYKIVDAKGKEIYNGSAHAFTGSNPTIYYNTKNLPGGNYRVFMENDNFFISTSFVK